MERLDPQQTILPSDRSVGLLFVVITAGIGTWQWLLSQRYTIAAAFFALAGLLLIVSLTKPLLLRPLNRAWMKLAEILHRIVSPLVLGLMFFLLITPVAVVTRLAGRDAMRRRIRPEDTTYWQKRNPGSPDRSSFPRQY